MQEILSEIPYFIGIYFCGLMKCSFIFTLRYSHPGTGEWSRWLSLSLLNTALGSERASHRLCDVTAQCLLLGRERYKNKVNGFSGLASYLIWQFGIKKNQIFSGCGELMVNLVCRPEHGLSCIFLYR